VRKRVRKREGERERGREKERKRERELSRIVILILKGMSGALAPFSYLVLNKTTKWRIKPKNFQTKTKCQSTNISTSLKCFEWVALYSLFLTQN